MTVWRCLTFVVCLNFSTLLYAGEDGLPFTGSDGCMQGPLAQFGKYLGDWKIEDSRLSRDGSGWSAGPGARWIFSCLGDDGGWNWTLEFSQDEGDSWIEVYRIRAMPFSGASADSHP
jgi:hypothetical protein